MKKKIFTALVLLIVFGGFAFSSAQGSDPVVTGGDKDPIVTQGDKQPCTGSGCTTATGFTLPIRLQNPLKVDNITDAIKLFMNIILKIALPFIILFFMWAGLQYILALGKPDKIKEAHKMFRYTIIGTLLILGAWTITNAIIGTINSLIG